MITIITLDKTDNGLRIH